MTYADSDTNLTDGPNSPLEAALDQRDFDLMHMVRSAVINRNVMLAYQPVVSANRPETVAYWEGLMRLFDTTGRVIPTPQFGPLVETNELGRMLDCLALEMGLDALRKTPDLRLAINMSARSIGYGPWRRALKQALIGQPELGERLILEITEKSAMLIPDAVSVFMAETQPLGVAFALDDFGAGYTAFRYLKEFYFDLIKIDGQFIRGIAQSPDNQVLANALISIAHHFEMFTVAGHVESAEDAQHLMDAGIDCLQGMFFGAPTLRPIWIEQEAQRATG